LSTPYILSTATAAGSYGTSNRFNGIMGVAWNDAGTKLYHVN
jgi:hypothetical protein